MSWCYKNLLRPALFAQDAEAIHHRTMRTLAWASRHKTGCRILSGCFGASPLPIEACGLKFPNPVGLAAGMDKHAEALLAWPAIGFGFTELGAVTWHPQPGNPPPRIFRAIPDAAIINRMGFNNPGAEVMARTLQQWRSTGRWPGHPVGMNLGKSKITPLDQAAEDYARSFKVLRPYLDFFVVNVSSPNTPNLRQLQDKAALNEILAALQESQASGGGPSQGTQEAISTKPIFVKVSPDLSFEALDEILELAEPRKIAGIVATNTTITRPQTSHMRSKTAYAEAGGLSGQPLKNRSTEIVGHLFRQTKGKLPIVGVGGIFDAADAWEKITAGACLIQIYTGLVYEGPGLAKAIVKGLAERLKKEGLTTLSQAVGSALPWV